MPRFLLRSLLRPELNTDLIDSLMDAHEILVAGEPGSHRLANTLNNIVFCFADDAFFRKCVLLIDGTSPVPGWEAHLAHCIKDMQTHGMQTTTCADYCA